MAQVSPIPPLDEVRIDQWAWAVRLARTRALVATACEKGALLVNGQRCRPAKRVRVGDTISFVTPDLTRTFVIVGLLKRRVGASRVADYLTETTPPELLAAASASRQTRVAAPRRESGTGRPTKRDRRNLEELMEDAVADQEDFWEFVKAMQGN